MRWLKSLVWNVQKPTPLMGVVREEGVRDEVVEKLIALIVGGFGGAVMLGLILFT